MRKQLIRVIGAVSMGVIAHGQLTLSLVAALSALVACSEVGHHGGPLNFPQGLRGLPHTTNCAEKDANGSCTKTHCTADAQSDCINFAAWCLDEGLVWSGSKKDGTCATPAKQQTA